MAVKKISELRKHNEAFRKDGISGSEINKQDLQETVRDKLPKLASFVSDARSLTRTSAKTGKSLVPSAMPLSEALGTVLGYTATPEMLRHDRNIVMNQFLKDLGFKSDSFSLAAVYEGITGKTLNNSISQMEQILTKDVEDFINTDIASGTTFIIREIFTEAVRLGYLQNSQNLNWISRTQPIGDVEVTAPQILKGNARLRFIGEGESIEFGTTQFGQKKIGVKKVGGGVKLSDEIVFRSSIDQLAEFLLTVGEDMGLASDVLAVDVMQNGEQADLSESAPIIGSESGTDIAWKDIVRVVSRMRRLAHLPQNILTQEDEEIDLNLIPEIKGFDGFRILSMLSGNASNMPNFTTFVHGLVDAGTAIFWDRSKTMVKLGYRSMMTERRRNPKTQEDEIFVSDWVGFAITRRDGRVVVDKDLLFSGNGFPSYMDVDAYQNNPFLKF